MRYVALLSGGKDSCYNLLHCRNNGHDLVAAASLGPGPDKEELDSYLYQTVGQDAIEYVARALEVPLYRRVITGGAIEQTLVYGSRSPGHSTGVTGDETEDLYELLLTVKSHHPDIQGVSVGAILSNYQRLRVEHVCRRLYLTPLCYLWQRDQRELLSEMIEAGMEAVLIKIAGIGLTSKHLGKSLAEMRPILLNLNDLYGSHICGEGGEYETLTLDCPMFKHHIVLKETEPVTHSDNDFASVAFLRIKEATLEPKDITEESQIQVPPLLDTVYTIDAHQWPLNSNTTRITPREPSGRIPNTISTKAIGSWVSVSNVQAPNITLDTPITAEVRQCFKILQDHLAEHSVELFQISNINIFLSTMDLFADVNAIYSTFFGVSPPARACVAVDLLPPNRVRLECTAYREGSANERQALHVQGLSYWAPANIGPYSQAIMVGERIFISGQIGLVPSNLNLPSPRSLAMETLLCCQHVSRVITALRNIAGGGWIGHTQANIYWLTESSDILQVKRTHTYLEKIQDASRTPTLFVVVKTLPKDALVEKQALVHTGRYMLSDDNGFSVQPVEPVFEENRQLTNEGAVHWQISRFEHDNATCSILCVRGEGQHKVPHPSKVLDMMKPIWISALSIRCFYVSLHQKNYLPKDDLPITYIPCRAISTAGEDNWDYALMTVGV